MALHNSSGAGAPGDTPSKLGQHYTNTANGDIYIAKGTSSSADWVLLQDAAALGTIASQDADAVAITGGSITNLTTFEIPVGAAPTVATDGEIAGDTTVTDFSTGVIRVYLNEEQGIVSMPIAQFTAPSHGFVVAYNATNDEFELVSAAGGGDVSGPVSSTDNAAALWDGVGGDTLKDSTLIVGASDATIGGNGLYRAGGTDVPVADGGTGVSSLTAYAVVCGGTTSTGAVQSIASVGSAGEVLTSNGEGALPTFQAAGAGGSLTSVARTIVAGAAVTTVSFTGLDLDAAGIYIIKFAIANTSASTANYSMYFNADTTAANYHYQQVAGTNNATNGAESASALVINIAASQAGVGSIEVQTPAGSSQVLSRGNIANYVTTTNLTAFVIAHLWKNAANPTQIDFTADVASAIGIGSYFEIYKLTY